MPGTTSTAKQAVREGRRRLGVTLTDVQQEAVAAVLGGRDTLLVSPTGSGKSAVYQLAGAMTEGVTVVVSPLIALQEDQLASLEALDVGDGVVISSLRGVRARTAALERLRAGDLEFVLLGPEQLARSDVRSALRDRGIDRLVVDEAHCIDLWGPDLRPDYLTLGAVRADLGDPPVLAATATAPPHVREEITDVLRMTDATQVVAELERPNIDLAVARHASRQELDAAVVAEARDRPGRGLVYVGRRRDAEALAEQLDHPGRPALAYHGSLSGSRRAAVQRAFTDDEVLVVATNAFGLGIDVADVRFVVHTDPPETVDAYAQEIGRAGRDGEPSVATLHVVAGKPGRRRFAAGRSVPEAELCGRLAALADPTSLDDLRRALDTTTGTLLQAVRVLERAGGARLTADLAVEPTGIPYGRIVDAVEQDLADRAALLRTRQEMVDWYVESDGCRWADLTAYLGRAEVGACGHCDSCRSADRGRRVAGEATAATVVHTEFGSGTVVRDDHDTLVVLFERAGYRTLSKALLADPSAAGAIRVAGAEG